MSAFTIVLFPPAPPAPLKTTPASAATASAVTRPPPTMRPKKRLVIGSPLSPRDFVRTIYYGLPSKLDSTRAARGGLPSVDRNGDWLVELEQIVSGSMRCRGRPSGCPFGGRVASPRPAGNRARAHPSARTSRPPKQRL